MSQEQQTVSRRTRRTRTPRHRPTLVTGTEINSTGDLTSAPADLNRTTEDLVSDTSTPVVETPAPTATVAKPAKGPSRLRGFFTKVDKEEGGKTASDTSKNQPTRPPSLFKVRHFIGLGLYLLVAQVALPVEREIATRAGIEKTLFVVPGISWAVTTSFLFNIITLLLMLYALVHFDLLPNSKSIAADRAKQRVANSRGGGANNTPVAKKAQPVVRQGVKGANDDLYNAYRSNLKRDKKK